MTWTSAQLECTRYFAAHLFRSSILKNASKHLESAILRRRARTLWARTAANAKRGTKTSEAASEANVKTSTNARSEINVPEKRISTASMFQADTDANAKTE